MLGGRQVLPLQRKRGGGGYRPVLETRELEVLAMLKCGDAKSFHPFKRGLK